MFGVNDFLIASEECTSLEQIRKNNGVDSRSFYFAWRNMPEEIKEKICSNFHYNKMKKAEIRKTLCLANSYNLMIAKLSDPAIYSVGQLASSLGISSATVYNYIKSMNSVSRKNIEDLLQSNYSRQKNIIYNERRNRLLTLSKISINWHELAVKFGKSSTTVQEYARDLSITSEIEKNFKQESERRFKELIDSFLSASKKCSSFSAISNLLDLSSFYYYFNKLPENVQEEVKINVKNNQTKKCEK